VISSRPASIRSKVDLPQPDGPTSTMNSPSWMSKLMPWMIFVVPKDFSMFWNETDAMPDLCDYDLTAPAVRPPTMYRLNA